MVAMAKNARNKINNYQTAVSLDDPRAILTAMSLQPDTYKQQIVAIAPVEKEQFTFSICE